MTQDHFYFEDMYVRAFTGSSSTRQALVTFHGFPGRYYQNEDVAQQLHADFGWDALACHHVGLNKSRGEFRFTESVQQAERFVAELAGRSQFDTIHLLGNSWGAFVALHAAQKAGAKLGRLALVVPFLVMPDPETQAALVQGILGSYPGLAQQFNVPALVADFQQLTQVYQAKHTAQALSLRPQQAIVIQALRDELIPTFVTREFLKNFSTPPLYLEVDQAHALPDRAELLAQLRKVLSDT